MPFSMNSIPMEGRTPQQIKEHLELYNRSQDICLIHNPSEQDYTFFYNRRFEPNPYIVPGCNKDIGFGKGNLEIRRYLANKYIEKKGEQMIMALSQADWDKKKENYRLEERGQMEERLALRVTNKELWRKIVPQLYVKVVRRHEEEIGTGTFVPEKPVDPTLSNVEQIMAELGIDENLIEQAHTNQNEELTDEDKKKADLLASIV